MIQRITYSKFEFIVASAIFLFSLFIYYFTLCPTVDFIDSGELAAVAYTLGIAHPTGYPLFTIVGWVFAHVPLGLSVIYQLNLMSAFLCSAGLFFFFRFVLLFLSRFVANTEKFKDTDSIKSKTFWHLFLPSMGGALILGFSETYWSTALSVEVYSLHILFLSALLFLMTKAIVLTEELKLDSQALRLHRSAWIFFAYVLGLAFTNHMTTILLAPAFLFLYFNTHGFNISAWRKIGRLVLPFLIGFSVYLYLPIRSAAQPLMNWGYPVDFEKFTWHFTGKVYRVWLFASSENAVKQLKYFIETLGQEFGYVPIVLALIGCLRLWKISKSSFVFTLLLFLGCVVYSINYDIHDIDSYFLLAYIAVAILSAVGLFHLIEVLKFSYIKKAIGVLAISLFPLVFNYSRVDESEQTLVEQYTKDIFASIEPNGIIISYQWDYFISAAYYFQNVESFRKDITIIDKELLRRSWYFNQLETTHKFIIDKSKSAINTFLKELYKFEHDLPYDGRVIESYYTNLILSIIGENIKERPVYVTEEIEPQYTRGYQRVPAGLVYRLFPIDTLYHELEIPKYNPKFPRRTNKYVEGIKRFYSRAIVK